MHVRVYMYMNWTLLCSKFSCRIRTLSNLPSPWYSTDVTPALLMRIQSFAKAVCKHNNLQLKMSKKTCTIVYACLTSHCACPSCRSVCVFSAGLTFHRWFWQLRQRDVTSQHARCAAHSLWVLVLGRCASVSATSARYKWSGVRGPKPLDVPRVS